MWFSRLRKKHQKQDQKEGNDSTDSTINEGIYYLYLIIAAQVAFVLGLAAIIMVVGKVMATPLWVFLFAMLLLVSGCVYIYRKARKQFRKFRDSFQQTDLSDKNYEISIMGGFLTMRVEQNSRRLLEAPQNDGPIVDADPVDVEPPRPSR